MTGHEPTIVERIAAVRSAFDRLAAAETLGIADRGGHDAHAAITALHHVIALCEALLPKIDWKRNGDREEVGVLGDWTLFVDQAGSWAVNETIHVGTSRYTVEGLEDDIGAAKLVCAAVAGALVWARSAKR